MDALSRAHLILEEVAERALTDIPEGTVLFDAHTHLGNDIDGMWGRPDEMLAMFDQLGITGSFAFCLDEPDRVPAFTAANDRTLAYAAASSRSDRPVRPARPRGAADRGGDPLPRSRRPRDQAPSARPEVLGR